MEVAKVRSTRFSASIRTILSASLLAACTTSATSTTNLGDPSDRVLTPGAMHPDPAAMATTAAPRAEHLDTP